MTFGVGFWTTPWLTWCGSNKYPELNLKESSWKNPSHTPPYTPTETYTHLPILLSMKTKGNFIQVHTSKYRLSPFFNSQGPKGKKIKNKSSTPPWVNHWFLWRIFFEEGRILFRKGKKKKEREKKSMVSPMSPHLEPWTVQVLTWSPRELQTSIFL